MALNSESILKEYEAAKVDALKAQQSFGSQQPDTFQAQLENAMLNRETMPSVARQERDVMKKFFTAPSTIRERLGGTVSPLQTEQLIGQQQGNWADQLTALSNMRKGKQDELKDIIASTVLGYKSQYEQQKSLVDAAKDKMDTAWDEYKEAISQEESRRSNSMIKDWITYNSQNTIRQDITDYMTQRADEEKNTGVKWDGKMGADEYIRLKKKAENLMGPDGGTWFMTEYPIFDKVATSDTNIQELLTANIDIKKAMRGASDKTREDLLLSDLETATALVNNGSWTAEDAFVQVFKGNQELIPELLDSLKTGGVPSNTWQANFLRYMKMAGVTNAEELLKKIFGYNAALDFGSGGQIQFQSQPGSKP